MPRVKEKSYKKPESVRGRTIAVGGIIQKVLHGMESKVDACNDIIFEIWDEAVGPEVSDHAQPSSLRGKVLQVYVDSSAWFFKLARFHEKKIKADINQRLGRKAVERIVFRLGTV